MKTAAPKHQVNPFPDYTKSLVNQRREDPTTAGVKGAVKGGVAGAVLAALLTRLMTDDKQLVGAGAAAGAIAGGIPGYISGRDAAKSEYSKLLFLRRRMGINEPGEYEALLRHPGMAASAIQKKAGLGPTAVRVLKGIIAGATVGGTAGYTVMPHISGYNDVEAAKRLSGTMGALTGGIAGGAAGAVGFDSKAWGPIMAKHPKAVLSTLMAIPGGIAVGELAPSAVASMKRMSDANTEIAASTRAAAIPEAVNKFVGSDTIRGAGVGAGIAGLGALATGLTRGQTEDEIRKNKSRAGMVTSDFLKYVIPGIVGGGVVGSMK